MMHFCAPASVYLAQCDKSSARASDSATTHSLIADALWKLRPHCVEMSSIGGAKSVA